MNKKLLIPVCIAAGFLISALLLAVNLKIILEANGYRQVFAENMAQAKDYKSVLGVKRGEDSADGKQDSRNQDTDSGTGEMQTRDLTADGTQSSDSRTNEIQGSSTIDRAFQADRTGESGGIRPYTEEKNVINVLFLGIDRDLERDKTLGIYRTDSIALAVINMDTKKVNVLCIPRDTYIYIPVENKSDKINHAYAYGSLKGKAVESSIDSINHFIKYSKVDYYFSIDMEPIPEIVDSLGGVEVNVETEMVVGGTRLTKGKHKLNGEQALGYVRSRYSGRGDIDRIMRQQRFAKDVFRQLKDSDRISETLKIALTYRNYIKTNMNLQQLLAFANLAAEIPDGNIQSILVPGEARTIDKKSCWVPDEKETDKILKELFWK